MEDLGDYTAALNTWTRIEEDNSAAAVNTDDVCKLKKNIDEPVIISKGTRTTE